MQQLLSACPKECYGAMSQLAAAVPQVHHASFQEVFQGVKAATSAPLDVIIQFFTTHAMTIINMIQNGVSVTAIIQLIVDALNALKPIFTPSPAPTPST